MKNIFLQYNQIKDLTIGQNLILFKVNLSENTQLNIIKINCIEYEGEDIVIKYNVYNSKNELEIEVKKLIFNKENHYLAKVEDYFNYQIEKTKNSLKDLKNKLKIFKS